MRWWLLGFLHRVLDRGSAGAGYRALRDCWEHRVCFCLQPQICRSQAQLLQHSQVPLNLWHSLLGKLESKLLQNWKFGDKKWCNVRVLKEVFNKDCYKCQYRVFLWKCQMQYCYSSDLKCKFLRFYQPKDMAISISTKEHRRASCSQTMGYINNLQTFWFFLSKHSHHISTIQNQSLLDVFRTIIFQLKTK